MNHSSRRDFLRSSAWAGVAWTAGTGDRPASPAGEPPERYRLTVVTLDGTPHERGLTHGRTLKAQIQALVRAWQADLAGRYGTAADDFIRKFLRHTDYLPAMRRWTPGLVEEVRGIARGADLDFDTLLVFQLIDEYWVNGPGVAGEHCSALGIKARGGRPGYVAQNMDLEGFRDGFQAVLRVKHADPDRESLVLTHAGLIGLNGLNRRSVGVCCNTLSQLASCRDGLPVACVVRGTLEQPTEGAALEFLHRVKHAAGQNYVVGGPGAVHDLECSAGKVTRFVPNSGPDVVWHTNHPLASDDYNAGYRAALAKGEAGKAAENSAARLRSLQRRLGAAPAGSGLELVREALAARDSEEHPVCRPHKNEKDSFTFASVIMVLSDRPELHVAPGPPDAHPYQTIDFSR